MRAAYGIDTSSPANLCVSTGRALVATRFSFDYGWYPPEDEMLETDLPFVSLWYAIGGEYAERDGDWGMTAGDPPRSVIIASEPLTADSTSWLEVSRRTPQRRGPRARATSSAVRTESLSKSTSTVMWKSSCAHSANFVAASTVLPP